jgi:hypothetical protein
MNRIILIGNGFDLAHGLKTSYKDFILWFWEQRATKIKSGVRQGYEDNFIKINGGVGMWHFQYGNTDYQDLQYNLKETGLRIIYKNDFLKTINEKLSLNNWVDIEQEYYNQLLEIKNNKLYVSIEKLNSEFNQIKDELEKYLTDNTKGTLYQIKQIKELIYKSLDFRDFTREGRNKLIEEQYLNYLKGREQEDGKCLKLYEKIQEEINEEQIENDKQYFEKEINRMELYPQNTLFLNFNYTDTSSKYVFQSRGRNKKQIIHIHGELNNNENPIIFGYGDELAEEYYEIEKLNDNEYLKNVKSINYLKTDNYKELLNFINSDSYQVFVFGHSCGNSDRTLLNTLFEDENCVSIKPFYYQKEKGTDNYEEIVMNISRNFKDKTAFRAKVVNKTYCKPLPQIQKQNEP